MSADRWTPAVLRDRVTGRELPGLMEIKVSVLRNGRTERPPVFRPLHLLTSNTQRQRVLAWLSEHRPDLRKTVK